MRQLYERIDKYHQKTEFAVVFLAGMLIIVMMTLITIEVVTRKLFNQSIAGVFEISSQLMVGVSLLGLSYVQQKKEHISIDLITSKLSPLLLKISDLSVFLLGFFITIVFTIEGWYMFIESIQSGEKSIGILPVPFWPGRLIVVLSMLFIAIRYLLDIFQTLLKFTEKTSGELEEKKV